MKSFVSKIWFPMAVVAMATAGSAINSPDVNTDSSLIGARIETISEKPDTVIYPRDGYKKGWTEDDFKMGLNNLVDTTTFVVDSLAPEIQAPEDTLPKLTARDTIIPPDSLKYTDPFRYKYYVALKDSLTHVLVRDSLKAEGDTLDWPKLDSLYRADSIALAKYKFDQWYNSLTKDERKAYDLEQKARAKLRASNRAAAIKDSIKVVRDSIRENTPRILETFAIDDSLQYRRYIKWTTEQAFHKIDVKPQDDTSFNYRFNDYPFLRNDVNATWLGVAGSPVQYYNYFNRKSNDKVSFYEAQESWSWTPETVPNYNTKTPYTELGYTGTLFAGTEKESDNLHILTTQNITPAFNFLLAFDRYGGGGILQNENTINKNTITSVNYLGKRYLAHAGYIYNVVSRQENGGISDRSWIRDTTVNAREVPVTLSDATSKIKKNVLYLDQQYRIPFTFIKTLQENKLDKEIAQYYTDSVARKKDTLNIEAMNEYVAHKRELRELADTTGDENITTAFIGHSTEYSSYRRWYNDKVNSKSGIADEFYHSNYYVNPNVTADSLRVSRFDNKVFIRIQPWSEDFIVSKINAGIGDRMLRYYAFDPTFTRVNNNVTWNSAYMYAGAEGKLRNYINWDARGEYVFLGKEVNDLNIQGNLEFNFYPFRRARKSPISVDVHFETDLDEPEYYQQHLLTNHYKWENDFKKISSTRIEGGISIPRWRFSATAGYALLSNNIFYDTLGIARQNEAAMSVLSATLNKEFVFGPVHLDNRALFQFSSNEDVIPLPTVALNLKYYLQFKIGGGAMYMQTGVNGFYNTAWYSPAWNPELGVFHNQKEFKYNNGPYFDAFVNMQWKRACIFVKYENAGQGWPMKKNDYFSAHNFIRTQRMMKIGIYWPFYTQPGKNTGSAASAASAGRGGAPSGASGARPSGSQGASSGPRQAQRM